MQGNDPIWLIFFEMGWFNQQLIKSYNFDTSCANFTASFFYEKSCGFEQLRSETNSHWARWFKHYFFLYFLCSIYCIHWHVYCILLCFTFLAGKIIHSSALWWNIPSSSGVCKICKTPEPNHVISPSRWSRIAFKDETRISTIKRYFFKGLPAKFTSWSCHACEPKQASAHRWKQCYHWRRRAYRAWGAKHQWWMHVNIECVRFHAWSWFAELDFRQSSIQAGPSVSCVPYFKACAEWKFETTRTWGSKGTGVGYLHPRQFAGCLSFCPRRQRWGRRVRIERDYRHDRGWWSNICLAAWFAREPSELDIWGWIRWGTSSCAVTSRPSNCDVWKEFQSEPRQCDMASRPSKFDFWWFVQSEPWQRYMASRPSKFDFWRKFQSEPGQRDMACRSSKFEFWILF